MNRDKNRSGSSDEQETCSDLEHGSRTDTTGRQTAGSFSHRTGLLEEVGDRLLSLDEAAAVLGVSRRSVQRLIAEHELPQPVKVRGSSRLYATDLKEFLARLREAYRGA